VGGGRFRISRTSDADMELVETGLQPADCSKPQDRKPSSHSRPWLKMRTSQSRLAKMEAGDSSVSLDLLFQVTFALGVSRKALASVF